MITVLTVDTPGLGDRSYLVHDGATAFVVDPQRDYDRVLDLAVAAKVVITHVFESHVHNDYLTGGLQLARAVGAAYLLNADEDVAFAHSGLRDGDVVEVGSTMRVRAVLTPGHTHTHLAYVLEAAGEPVAVFTGGSLLYGSTGRPDLVGPADTRPLAHAQWRSAHRLADLPDTTAVYPTHGFGSFCSASPSSATASTIGQEKAVNPVLTSGEEEYVAELLAGLDAFPAYYAHMAPANAAGPSAPDLTPPVPAEPAELRRRIEAGEWVVDLRTRTAFAAGHLPGSLSFGLDGQFATYLAWLLPWGSPVTLLGATAEDVAAAQRELVRVGIDRPAAMATGAPADWAAGIPLASFPRATFADLARELRSERPPTVLDVRRHDERAQQHVEGSAHVPIHEVLDRLDDIPAGTVWVHCASGYRASIVAGLLDARGRDVVAIDDSFEAAAAAGLPLVRPAGPAG